MTPSAPTMHAWFIAWIVTTQCVNFAFFLTVTRLACGWTRSIVAYVAGYLLPLAVALFWIDPGLHGVERGEIGSLAVGFSLFFSVWGAVTMAMSRGSRGRRFFVVLVCGVHQIGACAFSLIVMHALVPHPIGAMAACVIMGGMGVCLVVYGIPTVLKMPENAGWQGLNLTAVMNFMLLFATGFWPVYAPTGSLKDIAVFLVANVVAVVYFPIAQSSAERNRMQHALRLVRDNTRILQGELKSARAVEEGARRVRHDMRHHVAVVREMLASERVKEADEYLANLCHHELLSSMGAYRWCASPLVDAILGVAERKAAACGKKLTATADVPSELPFDEADIVSLFGNLIENALSHGVGDALTVAVALEHGILRLMVSNPVRPDLELVNGLPCAAEEVGLMSVRQVVEKHHGLIGYEIRDGELVCKVVIGCV